MKTTKSGVKIADDFRENLIIDRYDPLFVGMRAGKREHMKSENSEDAVTWNVFRTLRQINPVYWLDDLIHRALQEGYQLPKQDVSILVWKSVAPPPSLLSGGDEGISEVDVILEAPTWVWFIEAKYQNDISEGTKTRPLRNQVLRNIDIGSYYAGVRDFYFSLLISEEKYSSGGVEAVNRYSNFDVACSELPHRKDRLQNLRAVTLLKWVDLAEVFKHVIQMVSDPTERGYAERALSWLREKRLVKEENR